MDPECREQKLIEFDCAEICENIMSIEECRKYVKEQTLTYAKFAIKKLLYAVCYGAW